MGLWVTKIKSRVIFALAYIQPDFFFKPVESLLKTYILCHYTD